MDTHWKKNFKALGRVADRVARALFIVALLALTFGPMPFSRQATPTEAGDLAWTAVNTLPANALAISLVRVAADGTIFAVATSAAAYSATTDDTIWRSTDGGVTWTGAVNTAAITGTLPMAAAADTIVDLRTSPKYSDDKTVVVLTSNPAASTTVFISTNSGTSYTAATTLVVPGTAPVPTSLALAPNFSGTDGGVLAIGISSGAVDSKVLSGRWNPAAAAIQTAVPATGWNALQAAPAVVTCTTVAMAFSPAYSTDSTLVSLTADTAGSCGGAPSAAGDILEYRYSLVVSNGSIAAPVANAAFTARVAVGATATTTSEIMFSTDVGSDAKSYWLSIKASGAALTATDGPYKRTGTTAAGSFALLTPVAGGFFISGMVADGTFGDGDLIVVEAAASPRVIRSRTGGDSWIATNAMDKDVGTINAALAPVVLAKHPSYASNGTIYAAVSGTRGGVLKSTSRGVNWSDTALTNNNYSANILALDTVDRNTIFTVQSDGAGTNGIFMTKDALGSGNWVRVDRRPAVGAISASPGFAADATVWALDTTATNSQVLRSTDGGLTFKTTTSDPTNKSFRAIKAVSSTKAYVATAEGSVWWTTDGGSVWTKSGSDVGDDVYSIVLSPDYATDNTVLLGVKGPLGNLEVYLSTDGGVTFTPVGASTESDAWQTGGTFMNVAFGADYANSKIVFAAPNGLGDAIYRKAVGTSGAVWVKATTPAAITTGESGFVMSSQGYAYTTGAQAASLLFYRHFTPNTFSTTSSASWSASAAAAGTGFTLNDGLRVVTANSANYVYAVDVVAGTDVIRTFTDTKSILTGPAIISPVNNSSVTSNNTQTGSPITISWSTVTQAATYRVQIALDSKFDNTVCDSNTPIGCGWGANPGAAAINIGTGNLADGTTYYTRARVQTPIVGPYSSVVKFTVGASAQTSTPQPSLPQDGAQLPGMSTSLSWNNPAGSAQVQAQVTPLNNDGPAINLILGSATSTYDVPAPVFGTGPYVVLPGASYTWRIRTTNSTNAGITETDQSWGPWSTPRVFTTAPPNAGTIQLLGPINGESVTDTTPTVQWKDANAAMFYYEIQLSADPNFGAQGAVASVFWNLIHGGQANPPNSWTVPDANALAKGTYSWRVRQRLQATPKGSVETGIAWSPSQSFTVK